MDNAARIAEMERNAEWEMGYAEKLVGEEMERAADAARDRARQFRVWARYFRRYGESKRVPCVG